MSRIQFFSEDAGIRVQYVQTGKVNGPSLPVLKERFFDKKSSRKLVEFRIKHTLHSFARAEGRGFTVADILTVLDYGVCIFKQGLIFHYIIRKSLEPFVDSKLLERICNMVVVTDRNEDTIVTCYKSHNAARHIRRKSKIKRVRLITDWDNLL